MKRRQDPLAHIRHPVGAAILKQKIMSDLRSMLTDAQIHAFLGENDARLIDGAGRLAFIAADAAKSCQLKDGPDMNVVAGMANALLDLSQKRGDRELHRKSIQSGLLACGRIFEKCSPWAIGTAALRIDEALLRQDLSLHNIIKENS